jgi:hypothetical protein
MSAAEGLTANGNGFAETHYYVHHPLPSFFPVICSDARSEAPNDCIEMEYRETEHGFFLELVRLVVSLSAVGIGFELHKTGVAKPYGLGQPLLLEGKHGVSELEIHFFPAPFTSVFSVRLGVSLGL